MGSLMAWYSATLNRKNANKLIHHGQGKGSSHLNDQAPFIETEVMENDYHRTNMKSTHSESALNSVERNVAHLLQQSRLFKFTC